MESHYRVAIVGAGGISSSHLEVLKMISSSNVVAVVDKNIGRAKTLAKLGNISSTYDDISKLIEQNVCDVAHICVPPDLHCSVAVPLLETGINVFVEKPMATSKAECEAMIEAARAGSALIGVNQNMLFDPTFLELKKSLGTNELGNMRHLILVWNVPLVPLKNRQFGQWMFRQPQNIILEQAVHPISILVDLCGKILDLKSYYGRPLHLTQDHLFYDTWQVSTEFEKATVQMFLSFGQTFRAITLTAICDDGVAHADLVAQRLVLQGRSGLQEPFNRLMVGMQQARSIWRQTFRYFLDSILSTLRFKPDNDTFSMGMKGSIAGYYGGLDKGDLPVDSRLGTDLVNICEEITRDVAVQPAEAKSLTPPSQHLKGKCDIALLGGTGLIGTHLVASLLKAGLKVRVLARNAMVLPDLFRQNTVEIIEGDAEILEDISKVTLGVKAVVDLVYPKEGVDIANRMVKNTDRVVACCIKHGVQKLVYISSISAIYLGNRNDVITGNTPFDPHAHDRGDYSKGKADAERNLLDLYCSQNLPICILRPGIVIGKGGRPLHGGLAQYINEQHCLGFSKGDNPLPFVLVEDVAEAIRLAIGSDVYNGRTYNVVGDVQLTAKEYFYALSRIWNRPLKFHPRSATRIQTLNVCKWILKRLVGRRDTLPSFRDLKSLSMLARFDCSDIKRDLNWQPVTDRTEFIRRGIEVYL